MPTDLEQALSIIEKRAEKATPGPWEITHREPGYSSRAPRNVIGPKGSAFEPGVMQTCIAAPHRNGDADFIAASRTDVPALVKALRRAVKALDYHKGHVSDCAKWDITAILEGKEA